MDEDHEYLGDGVYASHDKYQVWLRVGSHNYDPTVALQPDVLRALVRYARRIGIITEDRL